MSISVTFRPVIGSDVEKVGIDKLPANADKRRGSVVTICGTVVLAVNYKGEVAYQDGSDAVADLLRAQRRVWDAIDKLSADDLRRLRGRDGA